MPSREDPLVTGEIYHVINRGVASMPIFNDNRYYRRFLETALYYQHYQQSMRYSYFSRLPQSVRAEYLLKLNESKKYFVEIICYCLMPNHFHFLLKQVNDKGISEFMRKLSESYTHYFNVKNKRIGPIFQGRFKSIRVETEQQLLHVTRYIHLNPYSSGIIKTISSLKDYQYSSLPEYLRLKNEICQKDIIVNYFKKLNGYEDFIFGQADYQRELSIIKHILLENPETD
ncbi:MAG: transposase [Candidatus Beckwithbacteria bacterium]|nr:transposase [Candidatus Beckwithbacteria bacterium]